MQIEFIFTIMGKKNKHYFEENPSSVFILVTLVPLELIFHEIYSAKARVMIK